MIALHLDSAGVWIGSVVSGLAALGWLGRQALRTARSLDALNRVAQKELNNNGGSSLKDAAQDAARDAATAVAYATRATDGVSTVQRQLDEHLNAERIDRQRMWSVIESLIARDTTGLVAAAVVKGKETTE